MPQFVSTTVLFPSGATSGHSKVLLADWFDEKDRKVTLTTEQTPFHPVDHRWPDQPEDTGAIEIAGRVLQVVDTVTAAVAPGSTAVLFNSAIPVPRATPGWAWLVAHIVQMGGLADPADLVGEPASLQVDAERRLRLSASHSGSHLFSFAFNLHTRGLWKGLAPKLDSVRNPNLDQLSIQSSRITETNSVDHYRFGRSMTRAGFHSAALLDSLSDIEKLVNDTILDWIERNAPMKIEAAGPQLEARRQWTCNLPIGCVRMACGGTHLDNTGRLECVAVTFERLVGLPEIHVHTRPELKNSAPKEAG